MCQFSVGAQNVAHKRSPAGLDWAIRFWLLLLKSTGLISLIYSTCTNIAAIIYKTFCYCKGYSCLAMMPLDPPFYIIFDLFLCPSSLSLWLCNGPMACTLNEMGKFKFCDRCLALWKALQLNLKPNDKHSLRVESSFIASAFPFSQAPEHTVSTAITFSQLEWYSVHLPSTLMGTPVHFLNYCSIMQ